MVMVIVDNSFGHIISPLSAAFENVVRFQLRTTSSYSKDSKTRTEDLFLLTDSLHVEDIHGLAKRPESS
jgi:hypothetical protein